MKKVTLNMSVLMASVLMSAGALAADAPAAPEAAAPAAAVAAPAPAAAPAAVAPAQATAPAAPVAADAAPAATSPAAPAAQAVVAPATVATEVAKAEEKEPILSQNEALALLKQSNCLLCHSIEKKVVGPAYKDVAAKYRGQADAEAKLFAKVTTGGKGVWGSTAMPPQKAKPENIKSLIRFVLALK